MEQAWFLEGLSNRILSWPIIVSWKLLNL